MPDRFHGIATQLLDCFRVYLMEQANTEGLVPPQLVTIRAGEVVAGVSTTEDEARCGLAWVRIVRYYPTDTFPQEQENWTPCGPVGYGLVLEMGVLRCAPVGTADALPTPEDWSAAVRQQMADAAAMRKAVDCCFAPLVVSEQLQTAPWEERAPEGGAMGGTQQVTVMVDACNDC